MTPENHSSLPSNHSFSAIISLTILLGAALIPCSVRAANTDSIRAYISTYIGTADFTITKTFATGFESIDDFAGFYLVPQNHRSSTTHSLTDSIKHSGQYSHYGNIYAANTVIANTNTNHRAYPTIQLYKTIDSVFHHMVFCEFRVRLNISLGTQPNTEWFSFATFTGYADDFWFRSILVNLDHNRIVHLMHVPDNELAVHDIFQTTTVTFPMNEWVKLSMLFDYTSANSYNHPYVKVWQNGTLVSAATFNREIDPHTVDTALWPPCLDGWDGTSIAAAESACGLHYTSGLAQAHFGLYAPPLLSSGEVWNDDLAIYEITKSTVDVSENTTRSREGATGVKAWWSSENRISVTVPMALRTHNVLITLVDIAGKKINTKTLSIKEAATVSFTVASLAEGVYFVEIENFRAMVMLKPDR